MNSLHKASIIFCLLSFGITRPAAAQTLELKQSSPQVHYQKGLLAYQKNNFSNAFSEFQKALIGDKLNPYILYNLGLSAEKTGAFGLAAGAWRRAKYIKPRFNPPSKALKFLAKKHPSAFPSGASRWESFRSSVLSEFSLDHGLGFIFIFTLLSGFFLIKYFGLRKNAFLNRTPSPAFPSIGSILSVLLLSSILLTSAKVYDYFQPRGTVLTEKQYAKVGPEESFTDLFELSLGQEVIIKQQKGDWLQIRLPGGITGWVAKKSLFYTSGIKYDQ